MDTTAEKNDTEEQRLVEPRIIRIKLIDGSRINSILSGLLRKKIRIDCLFSMALYCSGDDRKLDTLQKHYGNTLAKGMEYRRWSLKITERNVPA